MSPHHEHPDRTAQANGARASDEFWNRMELGRKESQRRAERAEREENDKKKEEKEKKGNFLWRKVLNRNPA
ncbi:hypothetical protein MMC07_005806 [Pseudocyphellaria aurata]|nr:hypothetical protein [Pseudocyphellaria aurata]